MVGEQGLESDDELVAKVALGDRRAFARLVERRSGQVMALAWRITGDRSAAEDIVQEAFARAWTKAPAWVADRKRAAYTTWLSRVVVNLAIDHRRKVIPLPLQTAAWIADASPPADDAMVKDQQSRQVRAAVAALPERQRAAIALTYDAGLSNADAARVLSTSVGAVELLLVRARRALKASLTETMGDGRD